MASNCYGQAEAFDSQTAQHKRHSLYWIGKQYQRREGEKESGWHYQQSGILHGLSSLSFISAEGRSPEPNPMEKVRNARCLITELLGPSLDEFQIDSKAFDRRRPDPFIRTAFVPPSFRRELRTALTVSFCGARNNEP
jgi:hypothetical protein